MVVKYVVVEYVIFDFIKKIIFFCLKIFYRFFVLLKMTEEKTFKEKMIEYNKIMGSLS